MMQINKRLLIPLLLLLILIAATFLITSKNITPKDQGNDFYESFKIEGENSIDLIDKSFQEEKIDYETSLIYKMYAIFGDDKLPAEYQSDVMILNANEPFIEIKKNFDSLSAETQNEITPFLKRPNDPESYYNQQNKTPATANKQNSLSLIPKAQARSQVEANLYCSTCFLPTANGRVKIWYPDDSINAPEAQYGDLMIVDQATLYSMAERIQIILNNDRIYERFTQLLQREPDSDGTLGGDDSMDIYIGPLNARAAAVAVSDNGSFPSSAYIIMNAGWFNFDKYYKSTLAHEMFHTFQYSYSWEISNSRWWAEATAVWSEDFIYKGFNSEQKTLKYFLPFPNKKLTDNTPNGFKYGAYIFPYYLSQTAGAQTIKNIWEDCTYAGCEDAIDDNISGGFKEQWKEFTLWNYNILPVRNYTDENGFPIISSSQNTSDQFIAGDDTIAIPDIKPLSAQVIRLNSLVDTNQSKQLIFKEIKDFTDQSDKAAIKAVIYLKDRTRKVEDWTDLEERRFCLKCDDQDENKCTEEELDYIVLIPSNADKSSDLISSELKTEVKEQPCSGTWKGTLKVTETMTITQPFVGTITQTWTSIIKEELEQINVEKDGKLNPLSALKDTTNEIEFHVMKQEIDYNYKESHIAGTITGVGKAERNHPHPETRGTLINDDTELDTIVRFIKKKKYDGAQSVLGQGEYIYYDADQIYGDCKFVAMSTGETKCPEYYSCSDSDSNFIGKEYIVEPTDNGTHFKGSDTATYSFMGATTTTKMEWDYVRY